MTPNKGLSDGLSKLKEHVVQHTWRSTVLVFKALRKPSISKDSRIAPTRPTLQWLRGLPDELINMSIYGRRLQPTTCDSLRRRRHTCVTCSVVYEDSKKYMSILNKFKVGANNHDIYDGNKLHSSRQV